MLHTQPQQRSERSASHTPTVWPRARLWQVRIITDDEQARSQGSDVARLSKVSNITARHDGDAQSHMHHKFAIVDGLTLLNGSFNWTRSAGESRLFSRAPARPHVLSLPTAVRPIHPYSTVLTNRENIVITTGAPELLAAFRDEFNAMWSKYAANCRMPQPAR